MGLLLMPAQPVLHGHAHQLQYLFGLGWTGCATPSRWPKSCVGTSVGLMELCLGLAGQPGHVLSAQIWTVKQQLQLWGHVHGYVHVLAVLV